MPDRNRAHDRRLTRLAPRWARLIGGTAPNQPKAESRFRVVG
jgi:hypothetical protein